MSEQDAAVFFEKHLSAFMPPDPFDAHAHIYRQTDATASLPRELVDDSGNVGLQAYRRSLCQWMGDAGPAAGLFFTIPKAELDRPAANLFVADEVHTHTGDRALLMIHPDDDPAIAEESVTQQGYAGFKVYHVFAQRTDTFNATPGEFIPDWAWQLANQHRLVIMLHIVRPRGLADPVNQQYICETCRRYPNARLILAHAARGFCGAHTVEGIASLRKLDNVYFDTSAICEPQPLEAILREFGPSRLMFGTDFPVSETRGRCVSIGDGFIWLGEDNVDWQAAEFARPIRVGIESLLALRQACRSLRLTDADVERIFSHNARELLGIDESTR